MGEKCEGLLFVFFGAVLRVCGGYAAKCKKDGGEKIEGKVGGMKEGRNRGRKGEFGKKS